MTPHQPDALAQASTAPKTHSPPARAEAPVVERFERALGELETAFQGEIDSIVDSTGRVILLPHAQLALQRNADDSERTFTRLKTILDTLPAQVAVLDQDSKILFVNSAWLKFCQSFKIAPPVGLRYLDAARSATGRDSDNAAQIATALEAVLDGRLASYGCDYPCHRPDQRRWFRLSIAAFADGPFRGAVVMHTEITEQALVAEALRASEGRYRRLVDTAAEGIWHIDLQGRTVYANARLAEILGVALDVVLNQSIFDFVHDPVWRDELKKRLDNRFAGISETYDYRFHRPDGTDVDVMVSACPIHDDDGHIIGALGLLTDISARKAAERRVKRQAELLDCVDAAIIESDASGAILFINRRARDLLLAPQSPASLLQLRPPSRPWSDLLSEALAHEECRSELEIALAQDATVALELRSRRLTRDPAGSPTVLFVLSDITEAKRLTGQILHTQRIESLGVLAGGIAHDLNNILGPILTSVEFLRSRLAGQPQVDEVLDILEKSAARGADIIRQVLVFARRVETERTLFDPRDIVRDVVRLARETFDRSITIVDECHQPCRLIEADRTQIHQVLLNLALNARDAMPHGGRLTFRLENAWIADEEAATHPGVKPGPFIIFTLSDSGAGIPESIQDRIFDPFFTTKQPGAGTGLGLSTALGIVRSHGGFLSFTSNPNSGTQFHIFLPAAPVQSYQLPLPAPPGAAQQGAGEGVLFVDDEEAARVVADMILRHSGYRPFLACHGADAVAVYSMNRDDIRCAVVDLMMPTMDGVASIRALRHLDPHLPIAATTGERGSSREEQCRHLGVGEFLYKPFTGPQLLNTLRQLLVRPV